MRMLLRRSLPALLWAVAISYGIPAMAAETAPRPSQTVAGMPAGRRSQQSLQRDPLGQDEPSRGQAFEPRLRAQSHVQRRLGHRPRVAESHRQIQSRHQPAACRAVMGPENPLGQQQRRRAPRRQRHAHRPAHRQARQKYSGGRSLQHVLHAGRQRRHYRRRSAQALGFPRSADHGDEVFHRNAAMRRHQPRRLFRRRPLRDLHL